MRLKLITPPGEEPLSLATVKLFLKQDHPDDDTLISAQIASARGWCEAFTGRALIAQTWELILDAFPPCTRLNPRGAIQLPKGQAQSVAWIKYIDTDGTEQTLTGPTSSPTGTGYQEDLSDEWGGILVPAYGASWPGIRDVLNPIRIQFTAGYTDAADIPGQLVDAMMYRVASVYENRGEQDTKSWQGIDEAFAQPYRLRWFG